MDTCTIIYFTGLTSIILKFFVFCLFQVEDDIDQFTVNYRGTTNPVLVIKGPLYTADATYIRIGKRAFSGGSKIQKGFFTLIQTHYFFNLKFEPTFVNFYAFFMSNVFKTTKPSTTVEGFMLQLK